MKTYLVLIIASLFLHAVKAQTRFIDATENLPEIVKQPRNSMDAKAVDIDKDGDIDLIVGVEFYKNVILLNDGRGGFIDGSNRLPDIEAEGDAKPYPWYPWHDTEDIAVADFDNDNDLDIVFVTEDDKVNEFYLNDGTAHFIDKTNEFPTEGTSNGVLAADFDNDNWVDIVVGNNGQNVYLSNNNGKFVDETKGRLPKLEDITQDLQAIDFDKDGDLDLLVANEKENKILINNGKGVFKDHTSKFLADEFLAEETREAVFVDVDNDGDLDLYFANVFMFQQVKPIQRLLINTGNHNFEDQTQQRLGFTDKYSVIDANFNDLDNDGDQDVIFLTYGKAFIYLNDGAGFFEDKTIDLVGELNTDGVDAEVADFNGDGKPDIYIAAFRGSDRLLMAE